MFRKHLDNLLQEQRERLLLIKTYSEVSEAFDFLDANGLGADAIDAFCAAELNFAINRKNDVQTDLSMRLNKYGWSTARIVDHMLKLFQAKMKTIGRVLKAFVDGKDPKEALRGYEGPKNLVIGLLDMEPEFENKEIFDAYDEMNMVSNLEDLDVS